MERQVSGEKLRWINLSVHTKLTLFKLIWLSLHSNEFCLMDAFTYVDKSKVNFVSFCFISDLGINLSRLWISKALH